MSLPASQIVVGWRGKERGGLKSLRPKPRGYTIQFHEFPLVSVICPPVTGFWNDRSQSWAPALKADSADTKQMTITSTYMW